MIKILSLGAALLITFLSQLAPAQDVSIEEQRQATHMSIKAGQWKEAKANIAKLKKLGKKDVAKECKLLSVWLKAQKKMDSVLAAVKKKKLSKRKAYAQLEALQGKYAKVKLFQEELRDEIIRAWRRLYVVVEDFERTPTPASGKHYKRVREPHKSGSYAIRWLHTGMRDTSWSVFNVKNKSWSEFEALCLYCYAEKAGQTFELTAWDGKDSTRTVRVKVNWTGWKQLRFPLHGKKSPFYGGSEVVKGKEKTFWNRIESIGFRKPESVKIDVVIDDIWLERK